MCQWAAVDIKRLIERHHPLLRKAVGHPLLEEFTNWWSMVRIQVACAEWINGALNRNPTVIDVLNISIQWLCAGRCLDTRDHQALLALEWCGIPYICINGCPGSNVSCFIFSFCKIPTISILRVKSKQKNRFWWRNPKSLDNFHGRISQTFNGIHQFPSLLEEAEIDVDLAGLCTSGKLCHG